MCGRFALGIPKKMIEEALGPGIPETWRPSFNIAPGGPALALGPGGWFLPVWGLAPPWAKPARPLINARIETVFDKPAFRNAARHGRCLVPAQAYYEWRTNMAGKTPFAFSAKDAPLLVFAAIAAPAPLDSGRPGETPTLAILTCPANELTAPVHDRMPVILGPEAREQWLDPESWPEGLARLAAPFPSSAMRRVQVSPRVNSPANDEPELLAPWSPPPTLLDF